jgi:hypothetical protein
MFRDMLASLQEASHNAPAQQARPSVVTENLAPEPAPAKDLHGGADASAARGKACGSVCPNLRAGAACRWRPGVNRTRTDQKSLVEIATELSANATAIRSARCSPSASHWISA